MFLIYKNPHERKSFYQFLQQCLDIPYVKVILSLRPDYLHYLLECNQRLISLDAVNNNILDRKILYYLGNLSPENAKVVIQDLTQQSQVSFEPALIDVLVADLAAELGEVRPIELQIVGAQLEKEKISTLEQYHQSGTKEELVERYLGEVIRDCGDQNKEIAQLFLYLLTDENNTRLLKKKLKLPENLVKQGENLDSILEILVYSGLLLQVGNESYQLTHDYLVYFIRLKEGKKLLKDFQKNNIEELIKILGELFSKRQINLERRTLSDWAIRAISSLSIRAVLSFVNKSNIDANITSYIRSCISIYI